jgi:phenylalanyl-tRNA synthetase beta chain
MKFTLSWLKDHLDTDASAEAIADKLTAIGLEVESLTNPAEALAPFTVAKVLTADKHPQADKLQVLTVDAGTGEKIQVVCGAPNARAGLVGVFGMPGAVVPANGMVLKVAAIRGVESNGMMCSTRELELGDDHDGIIELPADAPVGTTFPDYAGLNDPVIDVSITPNRQDCMGVRGIARDLAAAGLGTLKPLAQVYRVAAIAPVASRPVSSLVSRFTAASATGPGGYPMPAAITGRLRRSSSTALRSLADSTENACAATATAFRSAGSANRLRSIRPALTPSSTSCTE